MRCSTDPFNIRHIPATFNNRCRETKCLGYVISAKGIRMNAAKIEAIKDYPVQDQHGKPENGMV